MEISLLGIEYQHRGFEKILAASAPEQGFFGKMTCTFVTYVVISLLLLVQQRYNVSDASAKTR